MSSAPRDPRWPCSHGTGGSRLLGAGGWGSCLRLSLSLGTLQLPLTLHCFLQEAVAAQWGQHPAAAGVITHILPRGPRTATCGAARGWRPLPAQLWGLLSTRLSLGSQAFLDQWGEQFGGQGYEPSPAPAAEQLDPSDTRPWA